jgi:hypothetical protein
MQFIIPAGKTQHICRSAGLIMETAPFFRKWLKCVAVSHYPDGRVPHVVPDVLTRIAEREGRTATILQSAFWAPSLRAAFLPIIEIPGIARTADKRTER